MSVDVDSALVHLSNFRASIFCVVDDEWCVVRVTFSLTHSCAVICCIVGDAAEIFAECYKLDGYL